MNTKKKTTYQSPLTSMIRLESSNKLLAGSVQAFGLRNVDKSYVNDWGD